MMNFECWMGIRLRVRRGERLRRDKEGFAAAAKLPRATGKSVKGRLVFVAFRV
jgi:hypothetical protein